MKTKQIDQITCLIELIACASLCCKLYQKSGYPYGETTEGLMKWVKEQQKESNRTSNQNEIRT